MSRSEALLFLNLAHFFDHFLLLIFPTAALAIAPAWGVSYGDVLLLGSPVYAAFALGTLPAGWLGDRVDRMTLIAIFFLGCGGASLWVAASSGPTAMMIGLGALGLFAAIYHPVGLALVTLIGRRSGRALAVNGVFGNLGVAAAAAVTGVLAGRFGWQWAFVLPGALSILIGLMLLWRGAARRDPTRPAVDTAAAPHQPHPRATQLTVFAIVCVSALLGGLIFNAVTISLPKVFEERLADGGSDVAWVGASAGLVFAVAAFAQLPVGELLDRIGVRPVLLTLLAAQALLLTLLAQATGVVAICLALLLVTAVFAGIPITAWLLGRYLGPSIRSRALSIEYVLSLGVGSSAVPLIAVLHGQGYGFDVQYVGLSVCAVIILAAALFLPREAPIAAARDPAPVGPPADKIGELR